MKSCKAKKEKDAGEAQEKKPERIFHIKVVSRGDYWVHIEIKASSKLSDLDNFLRDVWLECCGHLSRFTIKDQAFMPSGVDLREMDARSMGVQIGKVLAVKDKFQYEYDFGSTTHLKGQVVSERGGALKEKVRILAKNRIPEEKCNDCGKSATQFCTDCEGFYCESCLSDHECGDEMAVPLVNSPRMGVCGYRGEQDPDDFERKAEDPEKVVKKRGLPESLVKYNEERRKKETTL